LNVLFIIRSLECGGAERQLTLLANGLAARGHRVTVAVLYSGGMREKDLTPAVQLERINKRSRGDFAGAFSRLRSLVKTLRPDIVHGYLTAGNLAATSTRLMSSGAKVIWAVRDSNMDLRRYSSMTRWSSRVASLLAFTADSVIANSRAGLGHAVRSGYPASRIAHVPNGIDVDEFYPDPRGASSFRQRLGIEPNRPLIGMVGRLDPMKDHECFLEAAAALKKRLPEAHFICAGDGSAERRLKLLQVAGTLELTRSMHWIRSCPEMRALYSALDVFCLSSRYGEGFPNVLGEAMACARPCVATDVGDSAAVAGDAASVVPHSDPQALAAAVEANLSRRSVPEARERIVTEFSLGRMIDRTEALLLSCMTSTSVPRKKVHYA
jgi:glycosyltransferase involved in cell wall biosynthesis